MQQSPDNRTGPDKTADARIATRGIHATDISVSTIDGVATLGGSVTRAKEKAHAVRVAKKVKGVKSVDSAGLTVK